MSVEHTQSTFFRAPTPVADDLQTILAHTPFLLTRCSSDLRYLFVSEAYARMIGRTPEDLTGKSIIEIMGKEGFNTILPHVQKVLQGFREEYVSDVHFKGVGVRSLRVNYTPEKNPLGDVIGWIAAIIDITGEATAQKLIDADQKAMILLQEVAFECSRQHSDVDECLRHILDAALAITGAERGNVQLFDQTTGALKIRVQHGFESEFLKFFREVRDHTAASCGAAWSTGQQIIVDDVVSSEIFTGTSSLDILLNAKVQAVTSTPLKASNGRILGMISTHFSQPHRPAERELVFIKLLTRYAADFLERKQADDVQTTLLREVQHRSNNLLTIVQSVAHHSLSGEGVSPKKRDTFEARLQALGRANRELVRSNWSGVGLSEIVQSELASFSARASIEGPNITLEPQLAQKFTLALHELVTNAVKHGALSNDNGTIAIFWTTDVADGSSVVKFKWQEIGGPSVTNPVRHGFGTSLLKSSFANVHLNYPADGLICDIEVHF
jgi:PAS domain S-box-containing protein